jgi:hypothetical protein
LQAKARYFPVCSEPTPFVVLNASAHVKIKRNDPLMRVWKQRMFRE